MTTRYPRKAARWLCGPVVLLMAGGLLAGCGGGGGGSSSTPAPTPQAQTATITGTLQDQGTHIFLANRTVTVQGTNLSGTSDSNGNFTISNVTVGSVTLVVTDVNGSADGQVTVDISKISGSPRSIGTVQLMLSTNVPPPPF